MDGGFVKNEEAQQQLFKFLPFYYENLVAKFTFSSHSLLFVISGFLRSRPSGTRMV